MYRKLIAILFVLAGVFGLSACDLEEEAQDTERKSQQAGYEGLTKSQPAYQMSYSPTRNTIDFWARTWDEPNKLAYMYVMNENGDTLGYYITVGPMVSMCASQTPTYRWEDIPGDGAGTDAQVPAPSIDGVYYSGGQCDQYYGIDASTGSYVEFIKGAGLSAMTFDQPVPRQDAVPLGFAKIEDFQ